MSATREWKNVTHRSSCRGLIARACVTALGLGLTTAVFAQDAAKEPPPLDVNAIQPGAGTPATPAAGEAPAATSAAATAPVDEGPAYPISRFLLEYKSEHPNQPSLDGVAAWKVKLGVVPGGFVEPREGLPTVEIRIGDVQEGGGGNFYRGGINEICKGVVAALNSGGLIGISVQMHPEDIDESTGADKRGGSRSEMRMIVWTGKVGQVRSISSGDHLGGDTTEDDPAARIDSDDPVQVRVRTQSPLQPGDLLRRDLMDNYVARLNRHAGRRVDVAISPGSEPEQVVVDYLVAESKPWSLYAQLSNTGTDTTAEWRERFGFVHNQLSGHDDILRVDYTTANFSESHALLLSYEFPVLSDRVRVRTYGSYTEFTASDVGNSTDDFEGQTVSMGAEVIGTIWQHREAFLDAYGGMRWKTEKIGEAGGSGGDENFFFPYVGLRFERFSEASSTFVDVGLEAQWEALSDVDDRDIQELGRPEVNSSWEVLKFSAEQSMYLEPLFNPGGYSGGSGKGPTTLAHEIVASVRGQYAFGYRLIASEEEIAGGMFTVRGYPESTIAGDSMIIGSLEYRFHLPRALGVEENPGMFMGKRVGVFGNNFRWQPQQNFGRADWDFILKGFVDAAKSRNGTGESITEDNFSLVGAGIGAELQIKRNFTMRVDWGFALQDVDDPANEVSSGDNRVHFSVTVLY